MAAATPQQEQMQNLFYQALSITIEPMKYQQHVRADAESYLVGLKESEPGLQLALAILSEMSSFFQDSHGATVSSGLHAQDPHGQRVFWACNAIIYHIGLFNHNSNSSVTNIAHNSMSQPALLNHDTMDHIYQILFGWVRNYFQCRNMTLPEFVLNKHAQTIVVGLQAVFPHRWGTFFTDVDSLLTLAEPNDNTTHVMEERNHDVFGAHLNGKNERSMCSYSRRDQIVVYFLRIFEYIDEVIVDRPNAKGRTKEALQGNMLIKDTMRETYIRKAVEVWWNFLHEFSKSLMGTDKNNDLSRLAESQQAGKGRILRHCLRVIEAYIEWIDYGLIVNEAWINLLYFLMLQCHASNVAACNTIGALISKKQQPPQKLETLRALRVVEVFNMTIPSLTQQGMPTTDIHEKFILGVTSLAVDSLAQWLIIAKNRQNTDASLVQQAEEGCRHTFPFVLHHLDAIPLVPLRSKIIDFLNEYVKLEVCNEVELQNAVQVCFRASCSPALLGPTGETGCCTAGDQTRGTQGEDPSVTLRWCLFNIIRLVYRRMPDLVLQHADQVVTDLLNCQVVSRPEPEVEGIIRYIYELSEAIHCQEQDPLWKQVEAILAAHQSFLSNPSPLVHVAWFELMERNTNFFLTRSPSREAHIGVLLSSFLQMEAGVQNRNDKARGRICQLFNRITNVLRSQFGKSAAAIFATALPLLNPAAQNQLLPSDRAMLFEACGILFRLTDLHRCQQVLASVLTYMGDVAKTHAVSQQNPIVVALSGWNGDDGKPLVDPSMANLLISDAGANMLADCMSYITALAKGVAAGGLDGLGGNENAANMSTVLAEIPQPLGGHTPPHLRREMESTKDNDVASAFLIVTERLVPIFVAGAHHVQLRTKTKEIMQQLIKLLGTDALSIVRTLMPLLLQASTPSELTHVLRVTDQFTRMNSNAAIPEVVALVGGTLLPLSFHVVARCGGEGINIATFAAQAAATAESSVISDAQRELFEVLKQLLRMLHYIVNSPYIAVFQHANTSAKLTEFMQLLLAALYYPPWVIDDAARDSVRILTNLIQAWCEPSSSIETYLFDSIIPTVLNVFTRPATLLDDAKTSQVIADIGNMLAAAFEKLSDHFYFRLYNTIVANGWAVDQDTKHLIAEMQQIIPMQLQHNASMQQGNIMIQRGAGIRIKHKFLRLLTDFFSAVRSQRQQQQQQ